MASLISEKVSFCSRPNPATSRQELDAGFWHEIFSTPDEASRCRLTLLKLARLADEPLMITGGLALSWHLRQIGTVSPGPFNDLDLVIPGTSIFPTDLAEHFLISHYHPERGGGRILLQLADRQTRARIDLFTPRSATLKERTQEVWLDDLCCLIVSAEDLYANLVSLLMQLASGAQIDPKYYRSFTRLAGLVNLKRAERLWPEYRKPDHPQNLFNAFEKVLCAVAEFPHLLQPEVYGPVRDRPCPWCAVEGKFPLSSPNLISEIWGYV